MEVCVCLALLGTGGSQCLRECDREHCELAGAHARMHCALHCAHYTVHSTLVVAWSCTRSLFCWCQEGCWMTRSERDGGCLDVLSQLHSLDLSRGPEQHRSASEQQSMSTGWRCSSLRVQGRLPAPLHLGYLPSSLRQLKARHCGLTAVPESLRQCTVS